MAWAGYWGGQPAAAPYHPTAAAPYEDFSPQHYAYPIDWQYPSWQYQYPNSPPSYPNMPASEPYGDFHTYHGHPASSYGSSPQTEGVYLVELGFPPNVDAAYDQVIAEGERAETDGGWYPEGAVLQSEDEGTSHTRYAWPMARRLPKKHSWNLDSLWKAASTIYDIRGLDRSNLPTARKEHSHLWGFDVNRLYLPVIVPHPNPPMPTGRGRLASKHHEREMEAFKWVFSLPQHRGYGFGHLYALQLHDTVLYDIIKELSKAVALRNLIMGLTGAYDVQQALRMAERERRAGERRVRFV